MNNIKLIITDLDGTIFDSKGIISQYTIDTVKNIHKDNVMFGIASGRPLCMLMYEDWKINFEPEIKIALNGGECYDHIDKKVYKYYQLKKEYIHEILDFMHEGGFDDNCFMYRDDKILTKKEDKRFDFSDYRRLSDIEIVDNISKFYENENSVILFSYDSVERTDKAIEYVNSHKFKNYKGFRSARTLIEFTDIRLSKSLAMLDFCKRHDIDISTVAAFGDSTNDDEIIKDAGIGVCMLNGLPTTKKCADIITKYSNDEDGFARQVNELIYKL